MADKKDDIVLSIRGMSKSFGRNRVLDHINLDVKRGTVMGLMGENGAGKSTMMKCLFGTYQKDEGTIYLDGKEISFSGPKDALENGIAMVHRSLTSAWSGTWWTTCSLAGIRSTPWASLMKDE